jgi:hypothetical protein
MEYILEGETLPAGEIITPLGGNEEYSNKEYRLNKLASINISTTEDEIISDTEFFADTVSY